MFVQLISKMKNQIIASVNTESVVGSEQKYCMKWEKYFDSESHFTNSIVLKKDKPINGKLDMLGAMNFHI